MFYLASPYSHESRLFREQRALAAAKAAAELCRRGCLVFSPIAHSHPMHIHGNLPGDWDFWERFDRWFIERCERLIVLTIDGWEQSKGVAAEVKIARELIKPVHHWNGIDAAWWTDPQKCYAEIEPLDF